MVLLISLIFCTANLQAQEQWDEGQIEQIKEKIHHLREMAQDAKEKGEIDKAKELMEQSQDMERDLKERIEKREMIGKEVQEIKQKIHHLRKMAQAAKEKGEIDKAKELMEQSQDMERSLRERREKREHFRPEPLIEKVYAFLKEYHPERIEKLERLKEENPEIYIRAIEDTMRDIREMEELKKNNPARFEEIMELKKSERLSWQLAGAYREEREITKKTDIQQRLRAVLNTIFEYKIKQHQKEIGLLTQEIEKLKARIQNRIQNKEKIIDKRLQEMIGEKEEFEWDR